MLCRADAVVSTERIAVGFSDIGNRGFGLVHWVALCAVATMPTLSERRLSFWKTGRSGAGKTLLALAIQFFAKRSQK